MAQSAQQKRILLLGDGRQVHLNRWSRYLLDNDYDVHVMSLESVAEIETAGKRQVHVPTFLPHMLRYPAALPEVRRVVEAFKPDLVNAHFLPNYGIIAAMLRFKPWVLSTWGSDIMVLPEKSAFHMWRTKWVIERATAITSDADIMSQRLVELGASPDLVTTFPFGVDRRVFHPGDNSERAPSLRIASNRTLESNYNVETIVKAFTLVKKQNTNAELSIASHGALINKIKKQASESGVGDSIRFPGRTTHEGVADFLRSHNIYISVALSDTTSVSLLEAMACGLFPIVSDIPANREWIEHGHNGMIVPAKDERRLADAIIAAWSDAELRRLTVERNAAIIEQRADWFNNMAIVKKLFDSLCASGGPDA